MTMIQFFSSASIVIAAFFILSVGWGVAAYIRDGVYDKLLEWFNHPDLRSHDDPR